MSDSPHPPMPKTDEDDVPEAAQAPEPALRDFLFPTVGTGVTVRAKSLEDAEQIVSKLK